MKYSINKLLRPSGTSSINSHSLYTFFRARWYSSSSSVYRGGGTKCRRSLFILNLMIVDFRFQLHKAVFFSFSIVKELPPGSAVLPL